MMLRTLEAMAIERGARVLLRADCDVAIREGIVEEGFRIRANLDTIRFLLERGARVRIISHIGRPHGKQVADLSLRPVGEYLARLLRRKVIFVSDPFSPESYREYRDSPEVLLLENLRFWSGEEANNRAFARDLSRLGDVFVNEAFANAHRPHASVVALPRLLPSFAGLHFAKEVVTLSRLFENPARPFVAVLGGAKLETKIPLIRRFLRYADRVLIGGALANTLIAGRGISVGKSLVDTSQAGIFVRGLTKLFLPSDVIVSPALREGLSGSVRSIHEISVGEYVADIGPETQRHFAALLKGAKTVVWNGPLGYAEASAFAVGTKFIARAITRSRAFTVVGGGDTVAALAKYKLLRGFSYVSTAGGAMLAFLAGERLPGVEALQNQKSKGKNQN